MKNKPIKFKIRIPAIITGVVLLALIVPEISSAQSLFANIVESIGKDILFTLMQVIHKELLGLTILTRNVFVSLRDAEDDFLKAHFALQELEKLPAKWTDLMNKILESNK